ncbi:MAG: phosphate ABC transporter ATP-binding protein [Betaproteobacteria bacterium]|nr:phosphate ABC transporter ATP-binding protein [Betaproteobacteria bacterium]
MDNLNTAAIVPRVLPLTVEGLGFSVGDVSVLRAVSFTIVRGSRNIVMGPNGAGKSVLLRLLHGLLVPTSGSMHWAERDAAAVRRAQAMVFQRPVMLRRSVRENLEFALRIAGSPDSRAAAEVALDRVGLSGLADRPARLCSGGEQQRVALARAWALQPEVLFLDEPTASLDPAATRAIEETIEAMHAHGTTIVMTTHNRGQAKRIGDRVLFLHHGRLVEDTSAGEFFQQPRSPEAAAFLRGELLW